MLTSRGFWFLLFTLVTFGVALCLGNVTLGVLGLTLLLWFSWEWLAFALRLRGRVGRLKVVRLVRDERGLVESLWAGQSYGVVVQLQLDRPLGLPYVKVTDWLPFGVTQVEGETERDGSVSAEESLELRYRFHCPVPGQVCFEGLRVQVADLQGFFYHETFLAAPQVYRVLPPLADYKGHSPAVKRHNILPLLGAHRHRRPGSGSELLDLRDYIPGDPPKTIAWKASARRDRLMTKEFESEVPVRCTLFIDTSSSVRVGAAGRNALTRLVEIGAAVAQASAAARDLTGLCLFDEHGSEYIRPARGGRHLVELLDRLAAAAGLAPSTGEAPLRPLTRLGYGLAQELYPELLRPDINQSPWWLPWLWPQPFSTNRQPTAGDRFNRWLFGILAGVWGAGLLLLLYMVDRAFARVPYNVSGNFGRLFFGLLAAVLMGAGFLVTYYFLRGYLLFLPARRRFFHQRKRLSALLSVRHGLAPGGLALLLEDDELFGLHVQRFLAEHQVPYPLPLYDRRGRYLFAAPGKVPVLAAALLGAVARGKDNELFVLMADLLELEDHLGPLLQAVKVARARHHRVMVVCPWPLGVPPPEEGLEPVLEDQNPGRVDRIVRRTTRSRFHRAFHLLRRTFARLGVQVVSARSGDPVRLILQRLEQLRLLEK